MKRPLPADVLVAIGRVFGLGTAADVYRALSAEPVTKTGTVVDWTQIETAIRQEASGPR